MGIPEFSLLSRVDQFIVSGGGASRPVVTAAIFQGFKLTALACVVLCASAVVVAFFMRARMPEKGEVIKRVSPDDELSLL